MLPELVGYFARRLGNWDDAADAASDTLVELLKRPDRVPAEETRCRQYVYGTARHVLARSRKRRIRYAELADRLKAELRTQEHTTAIPADPDVADAIGELRTRDQELLLLVAWEGFSVIEAGAVLGLKPEAARKRYSRLRVALRAKLS
ncbi:sigma-70 family RNA polymerase sigma factor [Leucobacter manosquensis]|uniref:Sigma-70 family RNA polymerase sigma factor n=1 Tax=Leucobacter manosquensis TaxID=2810611 RepID=A0ABS5M5B6_9MICO|nr:sigma-70 family RNA polymerase sigma factor [Leucobacter manosquensis]